MDADVVLRHVRELQDPMVALLRRLAEAESPTDDPGSQAAVQAILRDALEATGFRVRRVPGRRTGGVLLARPVERRRGTPLQLVIGHSDTVWPLGTTDTMPVRLEGGRLRGPGTFDMKAGLAQAVFALRVLRDLGLEPPATPVLLVNSDEEIGSPESRRWIRRLARRACRAWVLEPALGSEGRVKTARKGVGRFTVRVMGKAAHAGLDPAHGASAIVELARVIRRLDALQEPEAGVTVNVGVVEGGTRANVVAASARAEVDVRVLTAADGRRAEEAILGLRAQTPGTSLEVSGGMVIPPMEGTERNDRLWRVARSAGAALGLELGQATAGGASDGNVASLHTATLDGLGAVGDGAHAAHEHVEVAPWVDRCALLALLLMAPVEPGETNGGG